MSWLRFIVAALYAMRIFTEFAARQVASADTVPMPTALVPMKPYDMDGDV